MFQFKKLIYKMKLLISKSSLMLYNLRNLNIKYGLKTLSLHTSATVILEALDSVMFSLVRGHFPWQLPRLPLLYQPHSASLLLVNDIVLYTFSEDIVSNVFKHHADRLLVSFPWFFSFWFWHSFFISNSYKT